MPAPLTWFQAPSLAAARGGAVAAADQGAAFTFLGGGPSNVLTVEPADPAWQGISWSDPPYDGQTSISPGIGILGSASLLVFGGDQGGAVADTFLYYPATGAQAAASMTTPRAQLGFATDGNNLVYAIGGKDDNGTPLASMEYYTQSSNTWTLAASLPQTLYADSASYDGNGHIFTFGGVGADGTITSNVYEYAIATNTWTQAAAMPIAVSNSAAVLASNGLIYVLGGTTSTGATADTESYNPATNTWNTEASLPAPVSNEAVVSDALGRIEILGGYDASGNPLTNVWVSQKLNLPDSAPSFTSTPPATGKTGVAYSYQALTTANPQATYALSTAPVRMTIDPNTGLLQWTPGGTQIGSFAVTIAASNFAGQTNQSFTINVAQSPPTNPAPLTVSNVTDFSIGLSWNASYDPIGVSSYTVYHTYTSGPHGATRHYDPVLTVSGTTTTGRVTGLASGTSYSYVVRAFDSSGLYSGYSNIATATTSTTGTDILIVAGFPSPSTAGVAGTFTVTALNPAGSTDTSYVGTVHFTSNDYQAALPADYTFTTADSGVHTFSATLKTASTRSITATDTVTSTITGTLSGITINAAVVSTLSVYGFISPVTAGVETTFGVSAQDAFGNYTGYLGTVHFTSSDGAANLPADYTFVPADNGAHIFTATLNTAGYQSVTATDTVTATITGTAGGIYVNPAGTDTLSIAGFPSPSTAGVAGTITVTALTPGGATDTSYRGIVSFTSSDARAALPATYTFTAADKGMHSFSATLKTAGTQSITAIDTETSTITGTQSGITVSAAAATTVTVTGFPSPSTAGVKGSFTVTALDPYGNTASSYRGTVKFLSSDTKAVLPAAYVFTSTDGGVHIFSSGATFKTAGTQSITATDSNTSTITGTQAGISVVAAAAAQLRVAGFPSPVVAGSAGTFTVTARDAFGNTATSYLGTVHFSSNDSKAVLPANYTFVAADNGVHTFTSGATLRSAGTHGITATDTVTSSIAGGQYGIVVNAAATSQFAVSGFPSPSTAGTAGTFTVTADDAYGNKTTGYLGTVTFTCSDAQAVLPANYTFTSTDAGVHTFTNGATLKTAGKKTIVATDTVTSTITGKQTVTVNAAATSQFAVRGFPSPNTAGTDGSFTVTALDPYGNKTTGYTGTVAFTSSDAQAVLPANYTFTSTDAGAHTFTNGATLKTAGRRTIVATDTVTATITGQQTVTVNPAAVASLLVAGYPSPTTAGASHTFRVVAKDAYGNTVTSYSGTVTFSSSDAKAVLPANYTFVSSDHGVHTFSATFTTAGTQSLTATDTVTGTITGTQSKIVVNAASPSVLVVTGFPSPYAHGTADTRALYSNSMPSGMNFTWDNIQVVYGGGLWPAGAPSQAGPSAVDAAFAAWSSDSSSTFGAVPVDELALGLPNWQF
jgi:hypothetical protein